MKFLKSHFTYNKRQRNGIFFLLLIIVSLQSVFFFVNFSSPKTIDLSSEEIALFQHEMDSLKKVELEKKTLKIYPFNPNFISDFKGYQLGMSLEEIDKLHTFRNKGSYINSTKQFQQITAVNDSLLRKISPYFKFPKWTTSNKSYVIKNSNKPIKKQDINKINETDLRVVNGIGEKLAYRIIQYRTKLQGFSFNNQLYEVWNLDKEVVDRVLNHFEVMEPPIIKKININEAT
ncbi:MAG: helix-hairpin-helix domain-containing protein, partial [Lutibacter sp.]|nr:helix-hairpin-helix domain-containing protein [Lutibacter sp.]